MKLNPLKAILLIAFFIVTALLTYFGLHRSEAQIDFEALNKERSEAMTAQNEKAFESILNNLGSSTTVVKPDILSSKDTQRIALSITLLDTMQQYLYAAVLSERVAKINNNAWRYHTAARYFLMETEKGEHLSLLFKKAKTNLEQCLSIEPNNLNAKVDLAVSIYNINNQEPPKNTADLMRPALLLREVVAVDSNHIDGLYYLGKLAQASNQLEKAIERFKKLVYLQPQNREYYLELSQMYERLGNQKEAKVWLEKSQNIN